MKRPIVHSLLLVAALGGCRETAAPDRSPITGIRVQTDRADYRPVEMIVVTTENLGQHAVYDDHCAGEVQGFELLGRWNPSYGAARGCAGREPSRWREYSVLIPPRAAHVDTFYVNSRAYAGTWRVELGLRDAAGSMLAVDQRVSNTFQVRIP